MDLKKELGSRIRTYRRAKKMTQAELAEEIDVGNDSVSRIELGKANTNLEAIESICEALGVSVSELFEGIASGDMPKDIRAMFFEIRATMTGLPKRDILAVLDLVRSLAKN